MKHIALALLVALTGCAKIEGEWEATGYSIKECSKGVCSTTKFPGIYMGCDINVTGYALFLNSHAMIDIVIGSKCLGRLNLYNHFYAGEYDANDGMLVIRDETGIAEFSTYFGGADSLTLVQNYKRFNSTFTAEIKLRRWKDSHMKGDN